MVKQLDYSKNLIVEVSKSQIGNICVVIVDNDDSNCAASISSLGEHVVGLDDQIHRNTQLKSLMDISLEQPAVLRLESVVGLVLEQVVGLRLEIVAEFIGIRSKTRKGDFQSLPAHARMPMP